MHSQRMQAPLRVRLLVRGAVVALLVIVAAAVLSGPTGFRPGERSAEAALLSEVGKLLASDAQAFDRFGQSVAVSRDSAVVGAMQDDTAALTAGAAYVFDEPISVGGIAELPDVVSAPLVAQGSSGLGAGVVAGIVAAAGALALGGAAWYARRRSP